MRLRLLLVMIIVLSPVPAAAGPAEAKAALCRMAPTWRLCRVRAAEPLPAPLPAPFPAIEPPRPPVSDPPPVVSSPVPVVKPAPAPKPKAKPRVQRDEDDDERPARKPATTARKPTAAECAQIGQGIAWVGKEGVKAGARARGYSDAQIASAQAACGY